MARVAASSAAPATGGICHLVGSLVAPATVQAKVATGELIVALDRRTWRVFTDSGADVHRLGAFAPASWREVHREGRRQTTLIPAPLAAAWEGFLLHETAPGVFFAQAVASLHERTAAAGFHLWGSCGAESEALLRAYCALRGLAFARGA